MYATAVFGLLLVLVHGSYQNDCNQCDCKISGDGDVKGVHVTRLTCQDGTVTWYNPTGALRLELKPHHEAAKFSACFVVNSGNAKLKISQELETIPETDTKSLSARTRFFANDHNLQTVLTSEGKSKEICLTGESRVILYLEPEVSEFLGYQKIVFKYDVVPVKENSKASSMEDCRPCSAEEVVTAYCSSDFVVVGVMEDVHHDNEKTHINVAVHQIIRQVGAHFSRIHRDARDLQGTITVPRKCGVTRGDGLFLMTGRERLGELRMGCAPYLSDWETMMNKAELDGRLECSRD